MSDKELTPWFPGDVKPFHEGVYERRLAHGANISYSRWDGCRWMWSYPDAESAAGDDYPSCWKQEPWRGLTKEQK